MPRVLAVMLGSCKAVCAVTGLQCKLPEHPERTDHCNERGPKHGRFTRVAAPGQTQFPERARLDEWATRAPGIGFADKLNEAHIEHGAADLARRRKVSAHLGDLTTAGNGETSQQIRKADERD